MKKLSSIIKEPLVHFAISGAALFAVYLLVGDSEGEPHASTPDPIVVGPREIKHLTVTWKQLWNRDPTEEELTRLVDDYIREEALYREAIELGLDEDDMIVRRRMAQKMAFLNQDAAAETPTDEVLQEWFNSKQNFYEARATVSFSHVFFSDEQRGDQAKADAAATLDELRAEETPPLRAPERGDRFVSRSELVNVGHEDLTNLFGEEFSARVFELSVNYWDGPVPSNYGQHLVYISQRTERRVPSFDEIRMRIEIDWLQEQARSADQEMLDDLVEKHGVEIDPEVRTQFNSDEVLGGRAP